jgi:membrane carboxypeptidase/penicillin-binding protein PbpC
VEQGRRDQVVRGGSVAGDRGVPHHGDPQEHGKKNWCVDGKPDPLALKISGGVEPLTVLVNGLPTTARVDRRTLFVAPDGPGFLRLTVIDAKGAADSVMVRLQ